MGKNEGYEEAVRRIEETREKKSVILNLSDLGLTELPASIFELSDLEKLELSNNHLSSLPELIGNLVNLEILTAGRNQLSFLAESIGNLKKLFILDVSRNQLSSLPRTLKRLNNLQRLDLYDNPLLKIPPDIIGPFSSTTGQRPKLANPKNILEYYFRTRESKQPLNEAKLILVGRGEVGKSSLVDKLLYNTFDENKKKTEGIQITKWKVNLKQDETISLNIWDFGGQEIMHATHQFFLTARSLYLLVIDGRGGMEDSDADYWLKIISSFADRSPVIIILNKISTHPFDLNQRQLQEKYPFIKAFVKTDCFDGTGIDELLNVIKEETDKLDNLRDNFPAEWFKIKEDITRLDKNFLSFDEFRKFCSSNGENDQSNQNNLASYLHDLGIALNYKDDARLKDTHVLNPLWVTNGIYQILNSKLLTERKGEINLEDIGSILNPIDYPANMHRFIFDLMKKFELCFSFPDDECHYLIPELLDKQEPLDTKKFNINSCLNFQYNYSVLPNGLLPRFIVRTYTLSNNLPRWRSGVILKFDGCKALVKADIAEKKVYISVSGPEEKRIRLLSVIRCDFERIHSDIKNLNPEEFVPIPNYPTSSISYKKLISLSDIPVDKTLEYVNGTLVNVVVNELLTGVDIKAESILYTSSEMPYNQRKILGNHYLANKGIKLFISYSHKDEFYKNEFETHIKLLQRRGLITLWNDRKIIAGEDWKAEINNNLEEADIIVLMISADFINSDYCYDIEMTKAIQKHENKTAVVIPISLRKCNWNEAPFASIHAVPKDAKPVVLWNDRDEAWTSVSEEIEKVAKRKLITLRWR